MNCPRCHTETASNFCPECGAPVGAAALPTAPTGAGVATPAAEQGPQVLVQQPQNMVQADAAEGTGASSYSYAAPASQPSPPYAAPHITINNISAPSAQATSATNSQNTQAYIPPQPGGYSPPAPYAMAPPKNRWVALVLCIFFGVLGVHRFYAGKIGSGLLYLFTGGLFGIGWLVDIITIATGSFTDNFGRPLAG